MRVNYKFIWVIELNNEQNFWNIISEFLKELVERKIGEIKSTIDCIRLPIKSCIANWYKLYWTPTYDNLSGYFKFKIQRVDKFYEHIAKPCFLMLGHN